MGSKTIRLQVRDGYPRTTTTTRTVTVDDNPSVGLPEENFESGAAGWSLDGLWKRRDCRHYSGEHSLAYNQGACAKPSFDTGQRTFGSAVSPGFVVPHGSPVLSFKSWYHTEGGAAYDQKLVQISTDGGTTWQHVAQVTDNPVTWRVHTYSLAAHAGKEAKLRFLFDSIDSLYNGMEGWYIDEIGVREDADIVLHMSEWIHSTTDGSEVWTYQRHDGSWETAYSLNDPSDEITQEFYIEKDPGKAGVARLYVGAKSQNCSNALTHELSVNGQSIQLFSTCKWSSSKYEFRHLEIPLHLLSTGTHSLRIRPTCSCPETLIVQADDTSPGYFTTLLVDGASERGEAFWQLQLHRPKQFETLERYETLEQKEPGGSRTFHYRQEAFVFLDPAQRHSLYLMQRDLPEGGRTYLVTTLLFEKRAVYSAASHIAGWNHYVVNPESWFSGGSETVNPNPGSFYTWYRSEWELLRPDGGGGWQRTSGRGMQLVPSMPTNDEDGGMRPPAHSSGDAINWKISMEFYARSCPQQAYPDGHFPWQDSHYHDCWRWGITILEMDKNTKDFWKIADFAYKVTDYSYKAVHSATHSEFLKKVFKVTGLGTIISWFFAVMQTGDVLSIQQREHDIPVGNFVKAPLTVTATVPPVPIIPFDPQHPGHVLLWNGRWDVEWSTPSFP